jgi:hypothetical protein
VVEKNKAVQELGRLGGLKGGKARATTMTREERSEIARNAAKARWEETTAGIFCDALRTR